MEKVEKKEQGKLKVTRQVFLKLSLWTSGLMASWGMMRFLSYSPPGEVLLDEINLGDPYAYFSGEIVFIPEVRAWLVRETEGFYAISATCTHLGCTVGKQEDGFSCPCHGTEG